MNDHSESSTLPLEDDVPELPDDEKIVAEDSFVTPVSLIALNPSYASIALCGRKTVMGRNATKCSNGALLTGNTISGVHCEITSRSLEDMDAPIWIKDVSTNGVWVNGTKLNRDEATKISNKDIISFAAGAVDSKADAPVFMLIDKRDKSTFRNQQKEQTKRANDQLGIDPPTEEPEPEHKKQKTDGPSADNDSTKDKEEEDSAFEKEFECGICHEIMHKPVVLQPCLHSFCKECCKAWFRKYIRHVIYDALNYW
ncbi:hypothetical protein BGX28_004537 [Mortierella sp. GBA30]|nr:hypothetical protein BGX28_004537 [Mortierella sp. GBA30]